MGGISGLFNKVLGTEAQAPGAIARSSFAGNTGLFGVEYNASTGEINTQNKGGLSDLQRSLLDQSAQFGEDVQRGGERLQRAGASSLGQYDPTGISEASRGLFGDASTAGDLQRTLGQQFLSSAPGAGASALTAAEGAFGALGSFDPYQAAEDQFSRLDAILEPGRTRARTGTAAGLLSTGRLGSTAGSRTQGEVEGAIERERSALLSDQFGKATQVQQMLAATGGQLAATGTGQQQAATEMGLGLNAQALAEKLGLTSAAAGLQGDLATQGESLSTAGTQQQGALAQMQQLALGGALGIDAQEQAFAATAAGATGPVGVDPGRPGGFQTFVGGLSGGIGTGFGTKLAGG